MARDSLARIARLGETPRFWRLQAHEALWLGAAYDGRPSFWDGSVPLRERAPAVQSQIARTAGTRLASMVFGERAFPTLTVEPAAYEVSLSEGEVAALTALVTEVVEAAKLKRRMREYLLDGLKVGSACAILSLCEGVPSVELVPAKWCTPTLDKHGRCIALEVRFSYPDPASPPGDPVLLVYLRRLAGGWDRVYKPFRADSTDPIEVDREAPFVAGTVVWTRNLASAADRPDGVDGVPLIAGLEDEVAALDLTLSQRYRNGLYNGDPQLVQIVSGDASPQPLGPQGRAGDTGAVPQRFGGVASLMERLLARNVAPSADGNGATKKAPGALWKITAPGDAKMVESSGAGAIILDGSINHLRRVILDAMGVVLADPELMGKGDLSARALSLLHAPMLDAASCLRDDYGAALCAILDGFCRLLVSPEVAAAGVLLRSFTAAAPVLAKLRRVSPSGAPRWMPLPISLRWGEFFEPSWSDIAAAVEATTKAVDGRVMSRGAAVGLLAPLVGTVDQAAELDAIDGDDAASTDAVTRTLGALRDEPADDAPTITEGAPAEVDVAAGIDPSTAKDPAAALNGAQVSSMLEIVMAVSGGEIPRASGVAMLRNAFPLTPEQAEAIMDEVGRGFVAAPKPAPMPFAGAPKPAADEPPAAPTPPEPTA